MAIGKASRTMEKSLLEAFQPFVSIDAPALRRVLEHAFRYAKVDVWRHSRGVTASVGRTEESPGASEIVIDKIALLAGIIGDGISSDAPPSTSTWLVEWMQAERIDPYQYLELERRSEANSRAAFEQGIVIVASRSLVGSVLPRASALAQRTSPSNGAHLRHVLFALLEEPADSFGSLKEILTPERVPRLRSWLVDRIASFPPEGERVDVWRTLVATEPAEAVRTLSDAPALIDTLGRQAFAEVLASRIKQIGGGLRSGQEGRDAAFILHMDGPWGSGKTSVLNFLKEDLEGADPSWLVIEFNAWRNQHRKPSWWPLISQVGAAAKRLPWYQSPKARWIWASWNLRMRWVPLLLSGLLILAFLYFARSAVAGSGDGASVLPKALPDLVNGMLALVALGGLAWTASRRLFFGSSNAAEAYVQSSAEPFRPIVTLFERLVSAIDRPVAVFIDDLDRCDSTYVIELLEGIQTLLRSAPVVYVVAGDRKWICASFEKRYADFCGEIGTPGRPLGYLFLDKVFQLSTAIPQLSSQRQAQYWRQLLDLGQAASDGEERERERLTAQAEQELKGKTRHEDIQREIDKTEEGSLKRETFRAAAAKQITSPEAMRAAEHRLQPLAHLLEANPRSMKRLVNAYGLNHARAFLEGRNVSVEALARWTIIELRWPLLADHLSRNWPEIAQGSLSAADFPESIRELISDAEVGAVIGREGDKVRLTVESLKPILD